MFEFALAAQLHCTVAELRARLSQREFVQWAGYWRWKHQVTTAAQETAQREAARRSRRR